MKPQNDIELGDAVMYRVIEVLGEIEKAAVKAQRRLGEKVGVSA